MALFSPDEPFPWSELPRQFYSGTRFQMGVLLYGAILGLGRGLDAWRRLGEREAQAERLEAQATAARLEALASRLHPHFLFNALHTVGALIDEEPARARHLLAELGDLLRDVLAEPAATEVPLDEELRLLHRYLAIEEARFADRLRVELDPPGVLADVPVPRLLLQPLVENALRHGIAPRAAGGTVRLGFSTDGGQLVITVANDGTAVRQPIREGVGLGTTRERLATRYGGRASLDTGEPRRVDDRHGAPAAGGAHVTIRVVVVDDEPVVRRDLIRLLEQEPDVAVVGEAGHGIEALARIDELDPDAVFLDVQMPELDGLAVAEMLTDASSPLVVFVTAFDRYAIAAFEADAVDYLLKPFDRERLMRAVARLRERLAARGEDSATALARAIREARGPDGGWPDRLAVRARGRAVVVDLAEVRSIEASGNYARLQLLDTSYLTRRTMRELEGLLDPSRFVRVHRSHFVNLAHVRELRPLGDGDLAVVLADGRELVVTRTYRAELERRLGGVA